MKKIIALSLIITLPINIIGLIWAHNTKFTYHLLEKFNLTLVKGVKLHRIGTSEFIDLKHKVQALLGIEKKTDVTLILPNKSINVLNADLPLSGTDYKNNAVLILDRKALKGKAKLRGDHYYHWGFARKSWRFKTSKNNIHKGINRFNIIIPKSVDMSLNHLSYQLAKTMGLLAPDSRLVDFSVNGHYKGPRLLVEQIDESFLRKNNLMPNDIYKGDNIGQNEFLGIKVFLFENASIWEKASFNNHYDKDSLYPLEMFLDETNNSTTDVIDLKQFANMAAYVDLIGSYHHDRTHNWILFYDSYLEKMQPIIWDSVGWSKQAINLENYNIATSELFVKLYQNYDFFREKHKALTRFYTDNQNDFKRAINKTISKSRDIVKNNYFAFDLGRAYYNEQKALDYIEQFEKEVFARFARVREHFLGAVDKTQYQYSNIENGIRLSISGAKPVKSIHLKLTDNPIVNQIELSYIHGNQLITMDITKLAKINNQSIQINISLLANAQPEQSYNSMNKIVFHPATYDISIPGIDTKHFQNIALSFDNLAQETLKIDKVNNIDPIAFDVRSTNIAPSTLSIKTLTWSGIKHFTGFTLVKDNLVIEKGTQLVLEEGATLKVLGKVTAIGTTDEPIIFQAKDSTKPWGAFALKDERANGSVFKHVIFKGGSGDKGKLYEYTAMFSVHNVQNLLMEDTSFYDNKLTDDSVHIVYSDVVFRNCKFIRSLSDALDADISTVLVDNCEFLDSGNDAIDLMTSKAVVINSRFIRSADKGISIGEGSQLLAINNLIQNNEIGMQSKDTSLAYIYNTTFIDNKKAVDAYHKNWRYSEGGIIKVENCVMQNNIQNATVGKKSKVVLNNCQIDTPDNFNTKDLSKSKIVIANSTTLDSGFKGEFFENHVELVRSNVGGFYE